MEKRMVDFIRALRAAGVRISVAESHDAMQGVNTIGIGDMMNFKTTLRTTLVKEHHDQPTFDYFFPLFFKSNKPPLENINEQMSEEQKQMLQQAMQSLMGDMDALKQLMQQLMNGQPFSDEQLDQMGQMSGLENGSEMYQRRWFERRMMQQSGMEQMGKMMEALLQMLSEMGMSDEALEQLAEMMQQNMQGLSEQISDFAGQSLAERMAEQEPRQRPDLMDVPLKHLGPGDIDDMRDEVRRLAARLKSRAALRQKRANNGNFDPRRTLRANMRYGGTPIEITHRKRHKKPSLVLICDLSTSMRQMVEFFLTLVYELQDHVRRTNSFIFISDMVDVTSDINQADMPTAVAQIMMNNPSGSYNTDLGNSLNTFKERHMSTIDHRTTVIVLGDGRNNFNDPRLDIHSDLQRKARRLFWFCPESSREWGTGDSDMHRYAAQSDGVYMIQTLRDLGYAVDQILADS
ncbi:VWA domain-containing protein [Phototrophicus methaneseepsis]|uniref:VWA domain-containing protein n=1 Tax=Phototrophicus methaneseepsis TaxID=2710758 RepID=A0A7S8EAX6_9CHLR|nr:VWA domain-containing protein [Phototrophicus methaneseepsis]QPC83591.1 VWA domain-containing protein [Phototrophicus methaneseepsis]